MRAAAYFSRFLLRLHPRLRLLLPLAVIQAQAAAIRLLTLRSQSNVSNATGVERLHVPTAMGLGGRTTDTDPVEQARPVINAMVAAPSPVLVATARVMSKT